MPEASVVVNEMTRQVTLSLSTLTLRISPDVFRYRMWGMSTPCS